MERSITAGANVGKREFLFIKGIGFIGAGFILALTKLFGYPAPFAAVGMYAANGIEGVFLFIGAALGYTINGGFDVCVPYIAVMGAIGIIRYAVYTFLPETRSEFVRIICSVSGGIHGGKCL